MVKLELIVSWSARSASRSAIGRASRTKKPQRNAPRGGWSATVRDLQTFYAHAHTRTRDAMEKVADHRGPVRQVPVFPGKVFRTIADHRADHPPLAPEDGSSLGRLPCGYESREPEQSYWVQLEATQGFTT